MQIQEVDKPVKNKKNNFALLDMNQWSEIVSQWDKNKESQQAYCRRLNLSYNTFYYVRKKLKQKNKCAQKFIPVSIQSQHSSTISSNTLFVFENKNGLQLKIPLSIEENRLDHLLKLVGWWHA